MRRRNSTKSIPFLKFLVERASFCLDRKIDDRTSSSTGINFSNYKLVVDFFAYKEYILSFDPVFFTKIDARILERILLFARSDYEVLYFLSSLLVCWKFLSSSAHKLVSYWTLDDRTSLTRTHLVISPLLLLSFSLSFSLSRGIINLVDDIRTEDGVSARRIDRNSRFNLSIESNVLPSVIFVKECSQFYQVNGEG